ncbi:MAG: hypothetical protein JNM84_26130 [Planctomycetes bacterium]|nr:hypothetical protein [Planctomycetota bacterium]
MGDVRSFRAKFRRGSLEPQEVRLDLAEEEEVRVMVSKDARQLLVPTTWDSGGFDEIREKLKALPPLGMDEVIGEGRDRD